MSPIDKHYKKLVETRKKVIDLSRLMNQIHQRMDRLERAAKMRYPELHAKHFKKEEEEKIEEMTSPNVMTESDITTCNESDMPKTPETETETPVPETKDKPSL